MFDYNILVTHVNNKIIRWSVIIIWTLYFIYIYVDILLPFWDGYKVQSKFELEKNALKDIVTFVTFLQHSVQNV